jgi:Transposase DDE domain
MFYPCSFIDWGWNPMSVAFELEVCRRLPLADAAFRLLDYATGDEFLAGVFACHRGPSYENQISFPLFVHLIADALLGHRGSAHQTFQRAQDEGTLAASVQAMYGKLRRVPLSLSLGLFDDASARVRELGVPAGADPLPASLKSFWILGFDGKKLKYVAKKLKPLRGLKGNIFGGKLLVVQDLRTQQAVGVHAVADGEAADNPLVGPAIDGIRRRPADRPRLWVNDRAFCEFATLTQLSVGTDQFLTRYSTNYQFHPDPKVPVRTGTDDEGRPFREEWGWLGKLKSKRRVWVRKITVARVGKDPFAVVTSLTDADKYPATELLTLYRARWGLESMFQQVVQTFDLRHLIGATPQATVFQAMLCLLLYNITLAIRDVVAEGCQRDANEVSLALLFDDLVRDLTGWMEVLGPDATVNLLRATPVVGAQALRGYLKDILAAVWTDRWLKAPTRKQPPKGPPRVYLCGGHSSVEKILRHAHHEISLKIRKKEKRKNTKNPPPFETKKHV